MIYIKTSPSTISTMISKSKAFQEIRKKGPIIIRSRYLHTDNENQRQSIPLAEEWLQEDCTQQDISHALHDHYIWNTPVILRNAMKTSVACHRWGSKDIVNDNDNDSDGGGDDDGKAMEGESNKSVLYGWDYLMNAVNENTYCEVEMGSSSYNDPNMIKPEIPFLDYIQYMRLFESKYGKRDDDFLTWMNQSQSQHYEHEHKHEHEHEKEHEQKQEHERETTMKIGPFRSKIKADDMVYLAQNELFRGLQGDLDIPHLCSDSSYGIGNGSIYHTMIWMGPYGTVSPLHFDPLHNFLMQIVGSKRVILYPPSQSQLQSQSQSQSQSQLSFPSMSMSQSLSQSLSQSSAFTNDQRRGENDSLDWYYAGKDGQQYNTSPINVEEYLAGNDADIIQKYPNFKYAPPALVGIIEKGDLLFIPQKWWHHIRSLETSISVNTWWR